ncbi:nb-arc and tpr domain protein [Colletotrichum kahawae]|uniref:Nb-arc and tpr domain protein n=1 Tax=Colletotrichum kahawae TaxID=34407 RepID=A0AAD9Y3A4_COLKA|nr:nb-arc and tpr domain protein [Colletotrichum kahawae]
MTTYARPQHRDDFEIAVVCALPLESDAVALIFDEFWGGGGGQGLGRAPGDQNTYTNGRIDDHNVVLVHLPNMGKVSTAAAAAGLRSSYTRLKLAVLTGICGGVPCPEGGNEIFLGDVIISQAVVQYDLGRQYPDRFIRKNTTSDNLGRPNQDIRSLLASVQGTFGLGRLQQQMLQTLGKIQQNTSGHQTSYTRPPAAEDIAFEPAYLHRHHGQSTCGCDDNAACDKAMNSSCSDLRCADNSVLRRAQPDFSQSQDPRIFVGQVASGDTVMKSGERRDSIARDHKVIAFEMEGAGVWDQVPCLVVKGVCDYADSHKNKVWQPYAAAVAAATTKALLGLYPRTDNPTQRSAAGDYRPPPVTNNFSSNGTGSQYNNTGNGPQYNNTGGGNQFNGTNMTFGNFTR